MVKKKPKNHHTFPHIPTDLHVLILLHLPAKSLLRFRAVSKAWLRLIDSHRFAFAHLSTTLRSNLHQSQSLFHIDGGAPGAVLVDHASLVIRNGRTLREVMEFGYLNYRFEFHSYVNGVALLANRVSKGKTLFWDPSVRRFVFVPHFGPMRYGIGGGFDEEVVYRLGFDRLNNDYKILAVFYSEEGSFTSERFRRAFYDSSDERDDGTLFEYEGDLCSDDDDVLCRDDGSCGNSGDGLRNYSWDSLSDVGCDSLVCGRVDASGDHGAPFSVVEIYSLNSWTWKNVSTPNLSLRPLHPQVFVYDAIHWTGSRGGRPKADDD
ncbi:hypothetical protein Droror1_Dr00007861 [Drosera rotundifolia]